MMKTKTEDQYQPTVIPLFNLIDVGFVAKLQTSQQGDAQGLGSKGDQGQAGPQEGSGIFGVEVVTDLDENEPINLLWIIW